MKRLWLLCSLFLLVILMSVGFSDPSQFASNCDNTGCYISSCESKIEDISYIVKTTDCATSTSCVNGDDDLRTTVVSDVLAGGKNSGCYSAIVSQCNYDFPCSYGCVSGSDPHCCKVLSCDDFLNNATQCGYDFSIGCSATVDCVVERDNGAVCNATNGSYYCSDPLFDDCDSSWLNGCEVDLKTDENNCGSCGFACDALYGCMDGECMGNEWHDLEDNLVEYVDIGDYVKLASPYFGLGKTYDIVDGNVTDYDLINGSYGESIWQVNTIPNVKYLFRVNGIVNSFSGELGIDSTGGTGDNSPMNITIVEPPCGAYFNRGENVTFKIVVSDPDDLILGTITSGGNHVRDLNNFLGPLIEFNYTLEESGSVPFLIVANNTRDQAFRTSLNLMVYDSLLSTPQYYVAACIDEPRNFDVFETSRVLIKAYSSRGLKYDGGFEIIPPESLHFNWTFKMSDGTVRASDCSGLGTGHCVGDTQGNLVNFTRNFPTVNDNFLMLTVSIP